VERSNGARRLVLFRGRRRHRDVPDGQLELPEIELRSGREPIAGAELEVTLPGPVGHDSDELSQIQLGVETVQLAARDEREEIGGRLCVVVTAEKHPVFATRCSSQAILPISYFTRRYTTDGMRHTAQRSRSITVRNEAGKRYLSVRSLRKQGSLFLRGCLIRRIARA